MKDGSRTCSRAAINYNDSYFDRQRIWMTKPDEESSIFEAYSRAAKFFGSADEIAVLLRAFMNAMQ